MVAPIEQELKGIDGINVIRSTAYSGTMQITIEVDPNFKDRSRLVSDIQQAINRADLPVDLPADPIISEIKSEQTPVPDLLHLWRLSTAGTQTPERQD